MTNETYNGWANYATWRVALEYFDGMESCKGLDAESCEDIVREHVEGQGTGLTLDYALAFLSDVNWYEIADHLVEDDK
jgi:hypothetical protein